MGSNVTHIMLIDDDLTNNFLNKYVIGDLYPDVQIIEKLNGQEAINYLKNNDNIIPDIIFLDINMPVMNGFEFLENFQPMNMNILLFMLTSSVNDADYLKAKSYPIVQKYFEKPLTKEMLDEVMILINK